MRTKITLAALAMLTSLIAGPAFATQTLHGPGSVDGALINNPAPPYAQTSPWITDRFGPNGDRQLVRPY